MDTFLFTLAIFLTVILIMSVGVLFGKSPIKGSCGGIAALMGDKDCEICENKHECDDFQVASQKMSQDKH